MNFSITAAEAEAVVKKIVRDIGVDVEITHSQEATIITSKFVVITVPHENGAIQLSLRPSLSEVFDKDIFQTGESDELALMQNIAFVLNKLSGDEELEKMLKGKPAGDC